MSQSLLTHSTLKSMFGKNTWRVGDSLLDWRVKMVMTDLHENRPKRRKARLSLSIFFSGKKKEEPNRSWFRLNKILPCFGHYGEQDCSLLIILISVNHYSASMINITILYYLPKKSRIYIYQHFTIFFPKNNNLQYETDTTIYIQNKTL